MKTKEQYKTTLRTMLEYVDPPASMSNPRARGVKTPLTLGSVWKGAKDLPIKVKIGGPILGAVMVADAIPTMKKAYAQDGIGGAISVISGETLKIVAGTVLGAKGAVAGAPLPVVGPVVGLALGYTVGEAAMDDLLKKTGLAWKESPKGMAARAQEGPPRRRVNAANDVAAAKIGEEARLAAEAAGKDSVAVSHAYWDARDNEVKRQMELDGPIQDAAPISTMPPIPGLIDKVQSSKLLRSQVAEIKAETARSNERRDQKVAQADAERAADRAKHAEWMARHEADEPRRAAGLARSDDVIAVAAGLIARSDDVIAVAAKALRDKSISTQPK